MGNCSIIVSIDVMIYGVFDLFIARNITDYSG